MMPVLAKTQGELHPQSKLRNYEAIAIVELSFAGVDHREIEALFGLTRGHATSIRKGKRYGEATFETRVRLMKGN